VQAVRNAARCLLRCVTLSPVASRNEVLAVGAALFLLINVVFAPFLWGHRSLLSSSADTASLFVTGAQPNAPGIVAYKGLDPGAAGWQTEPEFLLEHHLLADEHSPPLWDPYVGFGQPLAADMISQPYYPLTWLVEAHPSVRVYNWYIALRFWLAAFFTFLFLRYFVGRAAAVAGAIAFALSGYLVLYFNIAHLSVEVLLPALFYAVERIVRRRDLSSAALGALIVAAVIFGGMPESAFLCFAFAAAYAIVRLTDGSLRGARWRIAGLAATAAALGGVTAGIVVLPFLEFLRLSLNQHALATGVVGLVYDAFNPLVPLTYLTPLVFGPPWNNILTNFAGHSGVRGFWGVAATYFAVVAVLSWLMARLRTRAVGPWSPEMFFAIAAAVLLLKRFGSPLVQWIGELPGFRFVQFPKYEEVLIGFSVAALAAFGIDRLTRGASSRAVAWGSAVLVLGMLTLSAGIAKAPFSQVVANREYLLNSLLFGLIVLALAFTISWIGAQSSLPPRYLGSAAALLIAIDLLGGYFIPMWYVVNPEPPMSRNPANGAPYEAYLQRATAGDRWRVLGLDGLLYPEWSSAFGISDVRDLNAMYTRDYLPFVRAFLPNQPELLDRFSGTGITRVDDVLMRRFLTLGSVRYLAALHSISGDTTLLDGYLQDHPELMSATLHRGFYQIGGRERPGVLMHPPTQGVGVPVDLPPDVHKLDFSVGMDAGVYANPSTICGDGVGFTIAFRTARGSVNLFHEYIDPKHRLGERHWLDRSIDLRGLAGRRGELVFTTDPGPAGDTCADWAVWGPILLDSTAKVVAPHSHFALAFASPEAQVYRYDDPLPRLAIYSRVRGAPDTKAALALLTSPSYDIRAAAVVTDDSAPARAVVAQLSTASLAQVRSGTLERYTSRDVVGTVNAATQALVVLNDTAYPGWRATVDGRDVPIVVADAIFRGVEVPAGSHTVEFKYRPESFTIGSVLTILGLLAIAALFLIDWRSRTWNRS